MERFVKGEVVVTPFPFSNLKSSVKRPALVVSNLKGEDLILCQITSRSHPKDPYALKLNEKDFLKGNLNVKSFIKPSILFTLRDSIILYSVGKINKEKMNSVTNKICGIMKS